LVSGIGNKQSLDYALVELEGKYRDSSNEVACEPNGTQSWLRVRKVAEINSDFKIVTMTASLGLLSGRLHATASYMRQRNQRTLQELYSVHLDGKLEDGDCGSGVVNHDLGDLCGHIVAGKIGTGFAYIVPAKQVFEDIFNRLGGDVTLVPVKPNCSKRFPTDRAGLEPRRLVELASKQYFSELKQPTQSNDEESNISNSTRINPIPAASPILPIGRQMPGSQCKRTMGRVQGPLEPQNSPRRPRLLDPVNSIRSRVSARQSNASAFNADGKGKGRKEDHSGQQKSSITSMRNRQIATDALSSLTFEQRFFALPSDLQVQIISSLRIPDILNLRVTSRSWHNLISLNETPISRAFLEQSPFPRFVINLYPLPDPSEITLHYICGQWHRLFVASRLSAAMTEWITKDIFLRTTETKLLDFFPQKALMRRRLVPVLFVMFHFFETYRHLHIKRLVEQSYGLRREPYTTNPIELQILSMYDNETLLQVHQVFPLLVSALSRMLRPPSYLSRIERSLRGYHKRPPPSHVNAVIFCIGGLREVAKFSEIEDYEVRRMAVDD
jgi:hypothetical protein